MDFIKFDTLWGEYCTSGNKQAFSLNNFVDFDVAVLSSNWTITKLRSCRHLDLVVNPELNGSCIIVGSFHA